MKDDKETGCGYGAFKVKDKDNEGEEMIMETTTDKDYLDTDEFTQSFVAVMDAYDAMEGPGIPGIFDARKTINLDIAIKNLKAGIRKHFLLRTNESCND